MVEKYQLPKYTQKQLELAFFQEFYHSFSQLTNLKKVIREQMVSKEEVLTCKLVRLLKSSDKRTYKAALEIEGGYLIETVLMNPKPNHWTVCISSQVGCAVKCTFCATGKMGLLRNLTSEEISDQVLFWQQFTKRENLPKINNIVYMGMGEPFHNRQAVFDSVEQLIDKETFNFGCRHISISTSGVIKGIEEMKIRFPKVNLALSLHAANDKLRSKLMPINDKHNLDDLRFCLDSYLGETKRKIFIEYILLSNENDSLKHTQELVHYIKKFKYYYLLHLNLIVYNHTDSHHQQSSSERAVQFKNNLIKSGLSATIRKNLGRDIDSACGQLVTTNT